MRHMAGECQDCIVAKIRHVHARGQERRDFAVRSDCSIVEYVPSAQVLAGMDVFGEVIGLSAEPRAADAGGRRWGPLPPVWASRGGTSGIPQGRGSLAAPSSDDSSRVDPMVRDAATWYRSMVARYNFLCCDRPDIQCAAEEDVRPMPRRSRQDRRIWEVSQRKLP